MEKIKQIITIIILIAIAIIFSIPLVTNQIAPYNLFISLPCAFYAGWLIGDLMW